MTIKLGLNYYSLEFIEVGARAITLSLIFNCIFCVFNVAARPALERLISSAFVLFKKGCMKFCVTSCNPFVQQHCWNRRRKALLFLCSFYPDIPGKHHPPLCSSDSKIYRAHETTGGARCCPRFVFITQESPM
jgi:hypothetical protein